MSRNKNNPKIQENGCDVLTNLSGNNGKEADIIEMDGLQACLVAMEQHPDHADVQASGCGLIGNLWGCPEVRKTVVDNRGLEVVLKAMDSHKTSETVQDFGCYALALFLNDEDTPWAQTVVDAGCIEMVITAMENHPNNKDLQRYGCQFLHVLAESHDDYRNRIIDAKGLTVVAEARRIHKDNADVLFEVRKANDVLMA